MLLLVLFVLAGGAMAAQIIRLGVSRADESLAQAQKRLYREKWIPTVRGRILDRKGRVLARNRASYEVAIDYGVLSGSWARKRAMAHARQVHAKAWPLLSKAERKEVASRYLPRYQQQVEAMKSRLANIMGIDVAQINARQQAILDHVEKLSGHIAKRRLRREIIEQARLGRQFTPELLAQLRERASDELAEQRQAHVIADVSDQTAFALLSLTDRTSTIVDEVAGSASQAGQGTLIEETIPLMPGLVVRRSEQREYPYDHMQVLVDRSSMPGPLRSDQPVKVDVDGVAVHILGWMGAKALDTDVARRQQALEADPDLKARAMVATLEGRSTDRGRYFPGDAVGRAGVEWSQESVLRGLRGLKINRLDTGEERAVAPTTGRDVHLTLDINLQARVQALLDPSLGLARVEPWQGSELTLPVGEALNGAAVVLDIDTGEILAMVSTPGFSREIMQKTPEVIVQDTLNKPFVNRAIAWAYPPGSIIKPLIFSGAVTYGFVGLEERIACAPGYLIPGRDDIYRCWLYRERFGYANHNMRFGHDLDGVEAITGSCNIFFYTLGRRMGARTIAKVLHAFGHGSRWNLGIGLEYPGGIGRKGDGSDLNQADATLMGIGQGPIDWTPLHAASAYATLARMGVAITPRIIDDGSAHESHETGINRQAIAKALEGIDGVINNHQNGTATGITIDGVREPIFNIPGIHVWGKTGTATAPDLVIDKNGKPTVMRTGDHAWVTVLVGREGDRPRYAISVIMEYGGSGGRVSGPIANQIIKALIEEGYL